MPALRALRLLNAVECGTTTGAQLDALLIADTGRLSDWNTMIVQRGTSRRMAASSTAMAAVAASSTAMAAVAASSTAMAAVAASSTAMAAVNANDQATRIWMLAGTGLSYSSYANVAAVAASSTAMAAVVASSTAMAAVAASSTAMAAVVASSTVMAAVAASSTAMAAVAASSTAMAAVWASNTAADAVLTNSVSKLAVYNADTALAALQANPTQIQRQITTRATLASATGASQVFVANGTKVILLRRYYTGPGELDMIDWARGSTTAATGQGPVAGSGGRQLDTGAAALGCVAGTYTSTGTAPGNDATGNFVAAANGLQRRSWSVGYPLNVAYLLV